MQIYNLFGDFQLPKPLTKEETLKNIHEIKLGNQSSRETLIIHNIRLVLSIVTKTFTNSPYKEELVSVGIIGLIKAVDSFNPEKNTKFSTYAARCISNEILKFLRKANKYINDGSLEEQVAIDKNGNILIIESVLEDPKGDFVSDYEKNESILEIQKELNLLKEGRDKEILKLYFGFYNDKPYTQQEIANMFGVSQTYIHKIIENSVSRIRNNMVEQKLIVQPQKIKRVRKKQEPKQQ